MKIENNAKRATNETASRRVLISPLMHLYEAMRKYRERKKAREDHRSHNGDSQSRHCTGVVKNFYIRNRYRCGQLISNWLVLETLLTHTST